MAFRLILVAESRLGSRGEGRFPFPNRFSGIRIISWLLHDGGHVRLQSSSDLLQCVHLSAFSDRETVNFYDGVTHGSSQFQPGA